MQRHAVDPGVFIRSLGTRGHHGGLTRTSLEAALLCLAAGFERVVVETVGVGQTELEIAGIADQVLVVLVPEAGDVVQTLKAGLLEGADILAVNKADRPGSDALVRELRASVGHGVELGSPSIPVHSISAREGEGVLALLDEVEGRLVAGIVGNRRLSPASFVARIVGQERGRRAASAAKVALAEGGALQDVGEALSEGRTNPYAAVLRVLETLP